MAELKGVASFPLAWPEGWKRENGTESSKFTGAVTCYLPNPHPPVIDTTEAVVIRPELQPVQTANVTVRQAHPNAHAELVHGVGWQIISTFMWVPTTQVLSNFCRSEEEAWSAAAARLSHPGGEVGERCACGHPKSFHYEDASGKRCAFGSHAVCPCVEFIPEAAPAFGERCPECGSSSQEYRGNCYVGDNKIQCCHSWHESRLLGSAQLNSENGSEAEKDGGSSRGPKDSPKIAAPAEAIQPHGDDCDCWICVSECRGAFSKLKPESPQAEANKECVTNGNYCKTHDCFSVTCKEFRLGESPQAEGAKRWRKKPVEIEAVLWTGENLDEVMRFCGADATYEPMARGNSELVIATLEDGNSTARHVASKGDYIIKGIAGEFYPCKPDIFKATYEPVESQPSSLAGTFEEWWKQFNADVSPTYRFYKSDFQDCWNAARQQSQPAVKVFDELWKDFIQDAEVEPSPEEEGFARWGWNMASGDYANGYIDGREAGYHSCGHCSHAWEAHDGECGAYMPDGSICGCTWVKRQQSQPVIEPQVSQQGSNRE